MIPRQARGLIEALLLAAHQPITAHQLGQLTGLKPREVERIVQQLRQYYKQHSAGLVVYDIAGGYQLGTRADLAAWVEQVAPPRWRPLSAAALETLAVVATRQPVTRADLEAARGVNVDRALNTLLEAEMVKPVGRREGIGRPILYGTTRQFLIRFGLNEPGELPAFQSEASEEPGQDASEAGS